MNEQIMQALTSLRDIHEPPQPSFWPMPIGWWILAICVVVTLGCLAWYWYTRSLADRPYREVRKSAMELRQHFESRRVGEVEYVSAINRLFKYVLINVEDTPGARKADGAIWLNMLAERFSEQAFVSGAGQCLGTVRYTPIKYFDSQLNELVDRTLCSVRQRKSRSEKP